MKIRVLIVDDEPMSRRRIRRFLSTEPDAEIIGEASSAHQAVRLIRAHDPEVVFLDIQMPKQDAFDVISEIGPERMPLVIFVTAYDEHAVRAFEVHALDYVLKPFDGERLLEAFRRARTRLEMEAATDQRRDIASLLRSIGASGSGRPMGAAGREGRMMIKSHGRVHFISASEIDWVEAAGNYIRLHIGSSSHLVRESLVRLEERLDSARFVRIHRSALVNLDRVKEMRHWSSGEYLVVLTDGTELKLSRRYRDSLLDRVIGRG